MSMEVMQAHTGLIKYDEACRAIAEAKSVDEVKGIRDQADALRIAARIAKNKQAEIDMAEIRLRSERRLGELMELQREAGHMKPGGDGSNQHKQRVAEKPKAPTLAEAGIDKNLANRARKYASLPADDFETQIETWREKAEAKDRVTTDFLKVGKQAENAKLTEKPVIFPEGKFGTIVIDPPWQMEKIERDVRPNQVALDYPTMNEQQLIDFGPRVSECAASDCHVFMWATHKNLPLAIRLLDHWGWKYVLTMVWHKPGGFQPVGLPQYNCEFVVYARRGSPKFVTTKAFNACFNAPRREHSRKPDEFYDLVSRVTGDGRIDIFSREKRKGFEQLGNETEKFQGTD